MISDADLLLYSRASEDEIETLRRLEKAAIAALEQRTGRYLGPVTAKTETIQWKGWPMQLANEPVGGLTSFQSFDGTSFSDVSASSYYLDGSYIYWNGTRSLSDPYRYRVTYDAGFTQLEDENETDAPEDIKQAVLMLALHWYENRESVAERAVFGSTGSEIDQAVSWLIDSHSRVAL